MPWWLTVLFAAAGVLIGLLAFELVVLGIILDLFLVPDGSGLFGFFFAPLFLAILLVRFVITALQR